MVSVLSRLFLAYDQPAAIITGGLLCFCMQQVIKGLQGGAFAGDMPTVMMWRLCNSSSQQTPRIRPSLGGMLASIMLHRIPQMRKRVRRVTLCQAAGQHRHHHERTMQARNGICGVPLSSALAMCATCNGQSQLDLCWHLFVCRSTYLLGGS